MRALTLHQPWATLVAVGAKTIETRGWSSAYRGPLVIHAAKKPLREKLVLGDFEAWPADLPGRPHPNHPDGRPCRLYCNRGNWRTLASWWPLPLGAVVATCTLADVVPMVYPGEEEAVRRLEAGDANGPLLEGDLWLCEPVEETEDELEGIEAADHRDVSDQRPYGDFAPGRYAWLLSDVRALPEPIPARGRQGLWTPDAELVAALGVAA